MPSSQRATVKSEPCRNGALALRCFPESSAWQRLGDYPLQASTGLTSFHILMQSYPSEEASPCSTVGIKVLGLHLSQAENYPPVGGGNLFQDLSIHFQIKQISLPCPGQVSKPLDICSNAPNAAFPPLAWERGTERKCDGKENCGLKQQAPNCSLQASSSERKKLFRCSTFCSRLQSLLEQ